MTHYLLLEKLPALIFDMNGLNLLFDYLMGTGKNQK